MMKKSLLPLSLIALLAACASNSNSLTAAKEIPGAEARVKVEKGDNENTHLKLQVKHLAQPEKVNPGAKTYVVWTRPTEQARPQNVGALKVDRNLTGKLETITPYKDFELFITAEPEATVEAPSGMTLLSTRVARK